MHAGVLQLIQLCCAEANHPRTSVPCSPLPLPAAQWLPAAPFLARPPAAPCRLPAALFRNSPRLALQRQFRGWKETHFTPWNCTHVFHLLEPLILTRLIPLNVNVPLWVKSQDPSTKLSNLCG